MKELLVAILSLLTAHAAQAQSVKHSVDVTPGHVTSRVANGVVMDVGFPSSSLLFSIAQLTVGMPLIGLGGSRLGVGL